MKENDFSGKNGSNPVVKKLPTVKIIQSPDKTMCWCVVYLWSKQKYFIFNMDPSDIQRIPEEHDLLSINLERSEFDQISNAWKEEYPGLIEEVLLGGIFCETVARLALHKAYPKFSKKVPTKSIGNKKAA